MNSTTTSSPPSHRDARPILALWCALLCGASGAAAGDAPGQTPREVVDAMSGQVLAVLRDTSVDSETRRAEVEQIIYAHVDFETLSRLVMARNWKRLSADQQREFKTLFKRHLSDTYGDNVDNYRNESVAILSERTEKRGDVTIKSKLVRGGTDDVMVNYRLRRGDTGWRIIDVVIEGVSLVANFRAQFQDIMSNGGPDRLLQLLRDKGVEPPAES